MNNISFTTLGRFFFKLFSLIIFAAAGVWLAALVMGRWYSLELSGRFVKWELLDGTPKFQEIVSVGEFDLRARAEDGTVYAYTTEWKPDPGYVADFDHHISANCESVYSFSGVISRYPPPEAGTPVECGIFERRHPIGGSVDMAYYVLLDNGSIWMWRHTRDLQQEIAISLAGLFVGLILGIIAWFLIQKRF